MDIFTPALVWFIVGTALALLEFAAPGIILIFFAAGAWVVSFTTWIGLTGTLPVQLLLFAVTSAALLVLLRRWVTGKFSGHVTGVQDPSHNLDEFTGKSVTVLEEVVPGGVGGKVEFKGASWSAVSEEKFEKDDRAVIRSVEGITLKIGRQE